MRRFLTVFATILTMNASAADWRNLFNGQDLDGWSGDLRLWSVKDGILTGETDGEGRKIDQNSFLIWKGGEPGDFELEFKARVSGDNNSGMQYRSRVLDESKWSVGGYQMDLHASQNYLGMLYEEQGRGIACERGQEVDLTDKPQQTGNFERPEVNLADWNDYRIVARGTDLQHYVNGRLAAEIHDKDEQRRSLKGVLALQVHAGPAMKAEFKDIRLRELEPEGAREPMAQWIWLGAPPPKEGEQVLFRREFNLPPEVASATLAIACDDHNQLWVNGNAYDPGHDWRVVQRFDVLANLNQGGKNVIAVQAKNDGGVAGLVMRLRLVLKDGRTLYLITDGKWLCTHEAPEGWQKAEASTEGWQQAYPIAKVGEDPWPELKTLDLPEQAPEAANRGGQ